MTNTELLLIANSLLLGLVGLLLGLVAFFLRDLHRQFNAMVLRVNKLYVELTSLTTTSTVHKEGFEKEFGHLKTRVDRLEDSMLKRKRPCQ